MLPRLHKLFFSGILGTLALAVPFFPAPAVAQPVQPAAADDDEPDVLARGPVHEAYASTVEMPKAGEVAPKAPPEPIEELPPDQKPEGDNVQWIPGYWDWDDERTDFIWISGFWRVPPPNHVWVPGSWNKVEGGYQWTSGFWQLAQPNVPQPELEYLPPPPQPIELGPSVPAPNETSIYVSGSWVYRNRYVWRPGFWIAHRPGWVWVPAHYRWTPLGYVFINGYWDYPLAARGVLFAPVHYQRRVFRPGYFYTPRYVVAEPILFGSLFTRRGYATYYFGDYYTANYGRIGYQPWCSPALRGVAVVPARGWHYDPLWNYYSVNYRQTPQWSVNIAGVYAGRYDGSLARPPRTLAAQNQVIQRAANINNVSNVTNNITVVNNNLTINNTDVSRHVMVAPLAVAPKLQSDTRLQPISGEARRAEAKNAAEIRQVAVNRQRAEAEALRARPPVAVPPPGMAPATPAPVRVKIDVPKSVVARSQVKDDRRLPPPAPVLPRPDVKVDPPKVETPRPKVDPPKPMPKVETPRPKVDPPKPPVVQPRVEPPKVQPRVDPPKPPVVQPRPPVVQPRVEPPKPPVVQPRVEPPKVQPRVDPPKPPVVQPRPPVVQPRVEPPKVQPRVEPPKPPVVQPRVEPPKVQPRVEPPKAPVVQPRVNVPQQPARPVVQPRVNVPQQPARPAVERRGPANNPDRRR